MSACNIILTSSSSQNMFKENKAANFTNKFSSCVNFDQDRCKIALQSIIIDANFSNVPNSVARLDSHFIIYSGNTYNETSAPLSSFRIDPQFYTLENLVFELGNKASLSLADGENNPNVKFSITYNVMQIKIQFCTLLIHTNVCEWLGIPKSEQLTNSGEYVIYEHDRIIMNKKNILGNAIVPRKIKVKLNQISGFGDKDLAILSLDDRLDNNQLYHTATRKEYFPLNTNRLEEATITLTDENNWPLLLVEGKPTIAQLIIKRMTHQSFMVRVNSEESKVLFPDNERENFRAQLSHPTDLTFEKWEVALTSINFPPTIDINCTLAKEDFWLEFKSVNNVPVSKKITFENENIYDAASLKECINRKVKHAVGDLLFVFNVVDKKANIRFHKPMVVRFSPLFSYVIGKDITMLNELNIREARELTFPKRIDLERCKPNTIFLQCDFVSPIIVGDKYLPVLKMIPFNSGKYESKHLDFMKVTTNNLSTIKMQLVDQSGKQIVFNKLENDNVIINLVFRKV